MPVRIKPNIYWVGGIDWDLRNFHGYITPKGTTYNSYLIIDEKIVLVDTVKNYLFDEMISRVKEVADPAKIDCVVVNHVEMDHSGSLPKLLELYPHIKIITSPNGKKGLSRYYKKEWSWQVVNSGDEFSTGRYTLKFLHVPMVHWPDSMVTYIPETNLLLSNDAFGQHIACPERFDDEAGWSVVHSEAAKYYANIVLPYGDQVKKALDAVAGLPVDLIAPSHGVMWRSHIPEIIGSYRRWSAHETEKRAVIIYDTMWGSTQMIAQALRSGLEKAGVPVVMRSLLTNHISDIVQDILFSKAVLIGTPTLNNGMMPSVGALLTYIKGLRPKNRIGFAFGSYGWGGQGARQLKEELASMGWQMPFDFINEQYKPDEGEIAGYAETGKRLGEIITSGV